MKIEKRKLEELKPAKYNPRKALAPDDAEYQKIKRSIEKFGYVDPIIINKDGTIIGGHQRHTVLSDMGMEDADVVVVDLNKKDEKALNIALNKISGEWDEAALRDLLIDLDHSDYDLSLTGFDASEIDELIELSGFSEVASDDNFDCVAAYEEPAIVKPGELWQLGNHRLMCGDATKAEDIAKLMGDDMLDLIITDPPYGIDYQQKTKRTNKCRVGKTNEEAIENDKMEEEALYSFLYSAFCNMERVMRKGAAIYVFHADLKGLTFRRAFGDAGLKLSEVLIWEKNKFSIGRSDYHYRHEPILYGWKEGAKHYFIDDRTQDTVLREDEADFTAMKKPELVQYIKDLIKQYTDQSTVIYEKMPMKNSIHPTMKPVELIGRLMKNSSKRGQKVGDFFGGSGSAIIAGEQLGRKVFSMELNPKYASVIVKRWQEFTGMEAVKVDG